MTQQATTECWTISKGEFPAKCSGDGRLTIPGSIRHTMCTRAGWTDLQAQHPKTVQQPRDRISSLRSETEGRIKFAEIQSTCTNYSTYSCMRNSHTHAIPTIHGSHGVIAHQKSTSFTTCNVLDRSRSTSSSSTRPWASIHGCRKCPSKSTPLSTYANSTSHSTPRAILRIVQSFIPRPTT